MTLESLRAFALNLPWFDYVGYLGMLLGLVSMTMRTIIPLRLFAIGACACLGLFALLREAWPTLVVNAATIPVLAYRTREMIRLTQRTKAAAAGSTISVDWLLPFMHERGIRAGETLFKKGDDAGEMFYICEGRLKLVEYEVRLGPGEVVGEIAMREAHRAGGGGAHRRARRSRHVDAEMRAQRLAVDDALAAIDPGDAPHRRPDEAGAPEGLRAHRLARLPHHEIFFLEAFHHLGRWFDVFLVDALEALHLELARRNRERARELLAAA